MVIMRFGENALTGLIERVQCAKLAEIERPASCPRCLKIVPTYDRAVVDPATPSTTLEGIR